MRSLTRAALATLAYDHPEWCWPELADEAPGFDAEGLGHPLLAESVLKTSDVAVDGPGRFLLVTGSNMSGKSTLLRSIGLAAVMAVSRAVVDVNRKANEERKRYESIRKRVISFTAAFERVVAEKHDQDISGMLNIREVKKLLSEADGYAGNGDYQFAIEHLVRASSLV